MTGFRASLGITMITSLILSLILPAVQAQSISPSPAPPPASDGTSIDLGIAYVLMVAALVLTYIIHPLGDASYSLF